MGGKEMEIQELVYKAEGRNGVGPEKNMGSI